ncbi:MAG TPA: DUF5615 family PIN-like protein [Candidatus Binatia bacterium]
MDNSLSQLVAEGLRKAGYDAVHVRKYALQKADDEIIFERAALEDRAVIGRGIPTLAHYSPRGRKRNPRCFFFAAARSEDPKLR